MLNDRVAELVGLGVAAHVLGTQATVNGRLDSRLDRFGFFGQVEGVAKHHGDGENGADRIDDALARDVRSRT